MVLQLFLVFEEPPAPHHQINQRIGEYLLKSYDALKICARLFKNDNKTSISLWGKVAQLKEEWKFYTNILIYKLHNR